MFSAEFRSLYQEDLELFAEELSEEYPYIKGLFGFLVDMAYLEVPVECQIIFEIKEE